MKFTNCVDGIAGDENIANMWRSSFESLYDIHEHTEELTIDNYYYARSTCCSLWMMYPFIMYKLLLKILNWANHVVLMVFLLNLLYPCNAVTKVLEGVILGCFQSKDYDCFYFHCSFVYKFDWVDYITKNIHLPNFFLIRL